MRHIDYVLSVVAPGRNSGSTGGGTGTGTGGGGSSKPAAGVEQKDVNFYDYDGTVIASYTIAEAQKLSTLPDAPTHEGLTFQGWNWSIDAVKALTRPMDIGAVYITDDGKTRIKIRIADMARADVPLYIYPSMANGVTIDWGDGSAPETAASARGTTYTHHYDVPGDYTIAIDVADDCTLYNGEITQSAYKPVVREINIGKNRGNLGSQVYAQCINLERVTIPAYINKIDYNAFYRCQSLQSIVIPYGVTIIANTLFGNCYSLRHVLLPNSITSISQSFQYCESLERITIPDSVTSIAGSAFQYCYNLREAILPDNIETVSGSLFYDCHNLKKVKLPANATTLGGYGLYQCYNLKDVTIPEAVTKIDYNFLAYCNSLLKVTIPAKVATIGNMAFCNCGNLYEVHMLPTTPPTMDSSRVFDGLASDYTIYVPVGTLEAYKAATNWTRYADHMVEEVTA